VDKEKMLLLISEAMDKGASINIHVPQYRHDENWRKVTKVEASDFINRFNELVDGEIGHDLHEKIGVENLIVDNGQIRVVATYFPSKGELVKDLTQKIEMLNQKVVYLQEDSGGDKIA
jgi:acetoin utilization deacetylase AcuC-like enzyme